MNLSFTLPLHTVSFVSELQHILLITYHCQKLSISSCLPMYLGRRCQLYCFIHVLARFYFQNLTHTVWHLPLSARWIQRNTKNASCSLKLCSVCGDKHQCGLHSIIIGKLFSINRGSVLQASNIYFTSALNRNRVHINHTLNQNIWIQGPRNVMIHMASDLFLKI